MDVLYPVGLFALFGSVAIIACASAYEGSERQWLVRWLSVALILRLAVAATFAAFPSTRVFHDDATGYEWFGMQIARRWHSGASFNLLRDPEQNYGFKYVTATVYYLFGQYTALAACFNCVIGTINIFMVYRLARQFFHPVVARRAALLMALVPSMILWNAMALKESSMSLLILLALSSCVALKRRFSIWSIVGIAVSLAAMQPLRYYMIYFLGLAIVLSMFLERGIGMVGGVYKQIILVGAIAVLLAVSGLAGRFSSDTSTLTFQRVSNFRHGMAVTANSGFDADVDISTPGAALLFMPIGAANLLLGPFPWQMGSLRALLAAPETIYWWLLFPSLIRGLASSIRTRFAETSPLVLFAVILTCAYSLMQGNVGSGFRQRAQIFIVLFIFAAYGSYRRRCERVGIDPGLLLIEHQPQATT